MKYSAHPLRSDLNGERKLRIASYDGDIQQVRELLSRGVNPNTVNSDGQTPLILAIMNGRSEAVEILLTFPDNKVNVNIGDNHGRTPLHWACFGQYLDIVKKLLSIPEIDPNITDEYGYTPLYSVAGEEANPEIFKVLLSAGADPEIIDKNSQPKEITELLDNYLPSLHTLSIRSIRKNKINIDDIPKIIFSS